MLKLPPYRWASISNLVTVQGEISDHRVCRNILKAAPHSSFLARLLVGSLLCSLLGCASSSGPTMPEPESLRPVSVLENNTGRYMSPYTSDGVLAHWVDAAIRIKSGTKAGEAAGIVIGSAATNNSGLGGLLGEAAGGSLGSAAAISAIGGEDSLRSQSDISFNSAADLAIFLYINYSSNEYYNVAIDAVSTVYSEFTPRKNLEYIVYAPRW